MLDLDPLASDPLHLRGAVALRRGNFNLAHDLITAAILSDPGIAAYYGNLGEIERRQGRLNEAAHSFRKALTIAPRLADAAHNLGLMLLQLGEIDEGRQLISQAIRLAPRPIYFYSLTDSNSVSESQLAEMQRMAASPEGLPATDQAALQFALGRTLNARGDKDRAFQHILAGNALRRQAQPYDEATQLALFDRVMSAFPRSCFEGSGTVATGKTSPIFVVGMPRSGTSLIEQILASHPRAFGAGELDLIERMVFERWPRGFPEQVAKAASADLRSFGDSYENRMAILAPDQRTIDKMPGNFLFVGLIHRAMPDARIIHMVRDPIDTCLSCFSTIFGAAHPYCMELGALGRYYRRYRDLMNHWRGVLPRGIMLEVRYEELVEDIGGQTRRILDHCGLDWDDACLSFHTTRRAVNTASLSQVRAPLNRNGIGRWNPSPALLTPLIEALGPLEAYL